jgi:CDP-glycerol glycerophosphotransferase (TagB/SpsB family)
MPQRHAPATLMDAESYARQLEDFLGDFDAKLDDRFTLIVRPAMQLEGRVDFARFRSVVMAPSLWDDHELLCAADCLITDQSSTLFDFLATGRQIVLFRSESDSASQDTERYFSEADMPFPVFHSAHGVGEHLVRTFEFVASPDYKRFAALFASPVSADAAVQLNDVLLGIREAGESAPAPVVDIVFIRYLTKKGRIAFEKLLESGYRRDDAVFVMSGHRYRARASAYLYELHTKRGVDVNYRVTSDRILLTTTTALMAWASRRFGWRFATLDRAYLQEARRIFGTTHVRSAKDFSGYKKFSAMARVIDENADSRPL